MVREALHTRSTGGGGGGTTSPGENFRGGNSAVKKSGEIFPRRNFGGTVPSFAAAAEGLRFLRRAKRLRTRLSQPFLVQMYEIWCCRSGNWCWRYRPSLLWQCVAVLESLSGACLVVFLQSFGRMALGALGISRVAKLSRREIFASPEWGDGGRARRRTCSSRHSPVPGRGRGWGTLAFTQTRACH